MATCERCGSDMKFVKGGISKAGKPYGAFWSCSDRECGFTMNAGKATPAAPAAPQAATKASATPNTDYAALRVQAAAWALQAACTRYSGMVATFTPEVVLKDAAYFYHAFLRPAFNGDVPEPETVALPGENPIPF